MKTRRLLLSLGLALIICLGTIFAQAEPAQQVDSVQLPSVGDRIGGFVVRSLTPTPVLGATNILFEHEKNGAQLVYLASDDPNVSFDITFRTPALDDTGKAHVFEHITVCGSQKYPNANLFFPFMNQTYNTFVNAYTYPNMTSYPLSSMSEDQLMTMMDYYLSGVFFPLLYSEPRMASREAWRYELSNPEDPITIAGTVYSEMQGALTTELMAADYNTRTMFEGSPIAHQYGGLPEQIRTLTAEDLIAFHDTYYHPSNALIVLYGNLDYRKFITYIDSEYISHYDRQEIPILSGRVVPYTQTAYATHEVPVEMGAQTQDATIIHYSFVDNDLSLEESLTLNILSKVLASDASAIMKLMRERLPDLSLRCSTETGSIAPMITFTATGANESDRDTVVQAIDEGLATILAEGIAPNDLEAIRSAAKLDLMLTIEDPILGTTAGQIIACYWADFGSTDYYNLHQAMLDSVTVDDLMGMLKKVLVDNPYRGVTVTKPAAGLAEENAAKLADELAQKKAAMSDAEIQALIDQTAATLAWSTAPIDPDLLGQIANMRVQDLPENLPEYDIQDQVKDGVRYLSTTADVSDVASASILLDVSAIPVDKLQDVNTYLWLVGSIGTDKYTKEELEPLITRYLSTYACEMSAKSSLLPDVSDRYLCGFSVTGLTENAQKGFELAEEILCHSDLGQIADIRSTLSQHLYSIRASMEDPLDAQIERCRATFYDAYAFNSYLSGIRMYPHLQELVALSHSDPAQLTARLESARALLLNRSNATVICAGSAGAVAAYQAAATALLDRLPALEGQPVDYASLRLDACNEALVNNSTVHFNLVWAPATDYSGKDVPIGALVNDRFLLPRLRNAMGAYGAYSQFSAKDYLLYTYRDPNLAATYAVFEQLPEYLRTMELKQADVDSYIVGSYYRLQGRGGKLSQALAALDDRMMGVDRETRLGYLKDAKATTVEDVRAAADDIERLVQDGVRSSSGAQSVIDVQKDLFERIVKLDAQ
ncbi:MAG: insulinase family protein [Clostridia bacterium]